MVEVFKTDVCDERDAAILIDAIGKTFPGCKVNFDLQDCDHILRFESCTGYIPVHSIIQLINCFGYAAEVLPDVVPMYLHKKKSIQTR